MATTSITIPADGPESVDLGGIGVIWKIPGAETAGRFSVVHHPLAPARWRHPCTGTAVRTSTPTCSRATLGALLGDAVVSAGRGSWVYKPRDQWHTFWNDGDTPCEVIEIISPAGFEEFFRELADLFGTAAGPELARMGALCERFGIELDPQSTRGLCERFGLSHPLA